MRTIEEVITEAIQGGIDVDTAATEILFALENNKETSLKAKAEPLMRYLAGELAPHHTAIVTATSCEIFQSTEATGEVLDYLRD